MLKKYVIWLIVSQLLVLLLSLTVYHSIDLLGYINISFIIGAFLILLSLTGYIINKGFFDIVFSSFQHIFSRMIDSDRRLLSQLIPLKYQLPFFTGILMVFLMFLAMIVYY